MSPRLILEAVDTVRGFSTAASRSCTRRECSIPRSQLRHRQRPQHALVRHLEHRRREYLRRSRLGYLRHCPSHQSPKLHCINWAIARLVNWGLCRMSQWGRRCPQWVKSGRDALKFRCPLYPRKRTFGHAIKMSALGQEATYALQQRVSYSITSSAVASSVEGTVRPRIRSV
jgi:hypothetical protein